MEEGQVSEKNLLNLLEPEELDLHKSEDHKIIYADIPERFQTRTIPVCKAEEDELKLEAQWILKRNYNNPHLISKQEHFGLNLGEGGDKSLHEAPDKIAEALGFIRNANLEVPFIAFYRKEHVADVLNIQDLWIIYEADEKWLHLRDRTSRLKNLLRRMEAFVRDVPESKGLVRAVKAEDFML